MGRFPIVAGAVLLGAAPAGPLAAQDTALPPINVDISLLQSSAAEAADPAELAVAKAIIDIMFPNSEREATFRTLIGEVMSQFHRATPQPEIDDPGMQAIVDGFFADMPDRLMPVVQFHLPRMLEATAVAYTNEFSLTELEEIHTFARTPAGKHYLSRSTALMSDPAVAAANTAYLSDVQTLARTASADLVGQMRAYLEEHPELVEDSES